MRFKVTHFQPLDIVLIEPGTLVGRGGAEAHATKGDVLGMVDGEAPGGLQAMGRGLGVAAHTTALVLSGRLVEEGVATTLLGHIVERDASAVTDGEVANAYVAHGMAFEASDEAGIAAIGIGDTDVADADVLD